MNNFFDLLRKSLIVENRYRLYLLGLKNTIIISAGALVIGVILGIIISLIKYSNKKFNILKFPTFLCNIFVGFLRGTPVLLQLMIMYFVILVFMDSGIIIAIISFGINSSAYISELFRGGLEAVDNGQLEAGRSLGFGKLSTMRYIILPQALKNSLPSLGNEFIALIKETSVVNFIGIVDVTFASQLINSRIFEQFVPLIISATIYLILVIGLTLLLKLLERRLRRSDNR